MQKLSKTIIIIIIIFNWSKMFIVCSHIELFYYLTTIYSGIPDSRSPQKGEIDSWLVRLLPGLLNKQIGITAQSNLYVHNCF